VYAFNLYHNIRTVKGRKSIIPCTPLAMIKILEHVHVYNPVLEYGDRLHGRTVTVVNRSEVVGRPLAAMLANDGARVFSVDVNGIQEFHRGPGIKLKRHVVTETPLKLEDVLPLSDIVIAGVPSEAYKIDTNLLKEGVVAINFSTFKNYRDDVQQRASIYVPSVGKVTVVMLQRNLVRLFQHQLHQQ
jgi:methylenetetrahydrofolate dehydrogenase (NAD+)